MYSVTLNGEFIGYTEDKGKIQSRINEYRKSGIYPGKNMIITYEADGSSLNIKDIRQMVKEMFFTK